MKSSHIVFFLIVGICGVCNAQIDFGPDKPKHLVAGAAIGAVGGYAAHKLFRGDRAWTWVGALGSSLAAGITKEVMDESKYGTWDNQDILFTVVGGAVSGLVLDLLLKNGKRRGRGRACNCSAFQLEMEALEKMNFAMRTFNDGSHDLMANIQAHSILSKPIVRLSLTVE